MAFRLTPRRQTGYYKRQLIQPLGFAGFYLALSSESEGSRCDSIFDSGIAARADSIVGTTDDRTTLGVACRVGDRQNACYAFRRLRSRQFLRRVVFWRMCGCR